MELRKSVRTKTVKKTAVLSDEEEEVVVKKTKLTAHGTCRQNEQASMENYGFGKRLRKKNPSFKNYKLTDDSDSDYDVSYFHTKKTTKTKRTKNPKPREATKIEFLLDWKREIMISTLPTDDASYKVVTTKKLVDSDLKQYGSDIQALFVNIKWNTTHSPDGVKIDEFKKLDVNKKVMKNGIIFIWSDKEILGKLIKIMEEKGFFYIENFTIALLDATKADTSVAAKSNNTIASAAKSLEQYFKPKSQSNKSSPDPVSTGKGAPSICSDSSSTTESTKQGKVFQEDENDSEYVLQNLHKYPSLEAERLLYEGEAEFLKVSKRVLMMFRRTDTTKQTTLELRHQRTCDALFDLIDPSSGLGAGDVRTKEYVYKMIETLLPKALYTPGDNLKMMELYADPTRPREGWISVCEKK